METGFSRFIKQTGEVAFKNDFHEKCINDKVNIEQDMENEYFTSNPQLNRPISMDEIKLFIGKLQVNKATGADNISNVVLKSCCLVHIASIKLFESCILPSVWLKSVINPIPKGSNKDPYLLLNYREISLLSCAGKFFSWIIDYFESNNIYEDE